MSSQEPPLPYVGAISLKNLLQNTQFQSASNSKLKLLELEEKKAEDDDINIKSMSARSSVVFGSSLWDASNIIPYTDINDFKVELLDNEDFWNELNTIGDVARLDEFLSGANMSPVRSGSTLENSQSPKPAQYPIQSTTPVSSNSPTLASALAASPGSPASSRDSGSSSVAKEVFYDKYSTDALVLASVPGEGLFNPGKRRFHTDELKPQPVIKKSRKTFVPDGQKDDRYWARRVKNNTAAKRSRDAKRIKENQIALRAGFLEEENDCLKKELAKYKSENKTLRKRIEKYEPL